MGAQPPVVLSTEEYKVEMARLLAELERARE